MTGPCQLAPQNQQRGAGDTLRLDWLRSPPARRNWQRLGRNGRRGRVHWQAIRESRDPWHLQSSFPVPRSPPSRSARAWRRLRPTRWRLRDFPASISRPPLHATAPPSGHHSSGQARHQTPKPRVSRRYRSIAQPPRHTRPPPPYCVRGAPKADLWRPAAYCPLPPWPPRVPGTRAHLRSPDLPLPPLPTNAAHIGYRQASAPCCPRRRRDPAKLLCFRPRPPLPGRGKIMQVRSRASRRGFGWPHRLQRDNASGRLRGQDTQIG